MRDTPKSQSAQYLRASMYEVLGIAPTASDEEVHAAYRRVVKRAHPDAGGSQRAFLRVNAAYRVLSDPGMRRAHDLWLAHLLDGYDQQGRAGGSRPADGRGTPDGRQAADGRHPASGRRPGPGGRPNSGPAGPGSAGPGSGGPGSAGPGSGGPVGGGTATGGTAAGGVGAAADGWIPAADGARPDGQPSNSGWPGSGTGTGAADGPVWGRDLLGDADESGRRGFPGSRRRSRRRSPGDPGSSGHSGSSGYSGYSGGPADGGLGQQETWSAWSDDDALPQWGPDRPARRRYLISMTLCLALFVLSGAVVRLYSVPVALGMMAIAMVIPPLAVFAVNTSRRR